MKQGVLVVAVIAVAVVAGGLFIASGSSAAAAPPPLRWISGVVGWDWCPNNCTAGSSLRAGNGVPNEAEPVQAGVKVGLGYGWCRYSHVVRYTTTDSNGQYTFSGLPAGTYCVTVNNKQSNTKFPKPGVWSRPSGMSPWYLASYTVNMTTRTTWGIELRLVPEALGAAATERWVDAPAHGAPDVALRRPSPNIPSALATSAQAMFYPWLE